LERDLGVRLFDRDRRSVALTACGKPLLPPRTGRCWTDRQVAPLRGGHVGIEPVRLGYVNWRLAERRRRPSALSWGRPAQFGCGDSGVTVS
jgi:hypothetical protein